MFPRSLLALVVLAPLGSMTAQMVDRTVAIVEDETITESEVVLQLRLEALANAAEIVDTAEERAELLARLQGQSFGNLSFESALTEYGVTEAQALEFFARQIEFSRYVEFRFRTGQTVGDEELRDAYRSKYGRTPNRDAPSLELAAPGLRIEVLNARVESLLEQHVRQLRADHRVVRLERIDRSAITPSGGAP